MYTRRLDGPTRGVLYGIEFMANKRARPATALLTPIYVRICSTKSHLHDKTRAADDIILRRLSASVGLPWRRLLHGEPSGQLLRYILETPRARAAGRTRVANSFPFISGANYSCRHKIYFLFFLYASRSIKMQRCGYVQLFYDETKSPTVTQCSNSVVKWPIMWKLITTWVCIINK